MSQTRQPKGVPIGGQFAHNAHDEAVGALSAEKDAQSVVGSRTPRALHPSSYARAAEDGTAAGRAAAGYYNAARRMELSPENWGNIEENLYLSAHNRSSSGNVWQPLHDELNGIFQDAESKAYRENVLSSSEPVAARFVRSSTEAVLSLPEELQRDTKESIRTLNTEDRAIADARLILGLRRAFRAIPGATAISDYVVKKTGRGGDLVRKLIGAANGRNRTISVLEETEKRGGERGERADRMLRMLRIADMPSSKIIDGIVKAKKDGKVAESNLRSFLSERSHLELSRFYYETENEGSDSRP